jgi:ABC-2 type transport system permease protein
VFLGGKFDYTATRQGSFSVGRINPYVNWKINLMIRQTLMIMKKEWWDIKTTLFLFGNLQAGILPILVLSGAFGIYEPIKIGPEWLQSPIMIFSIVVLIPCAVIGFISPNSIVGERNRKTLEPLLATPVTDHAILFGKIGIAVVYGWGMTLLNMILGLVVINLTYSNGQVFLYPINLVISIMLLSFLFSILIAAGGVNFSLYATSLLEAQNKLGMTVFIPLVLTGFMMGPFMPKDWKAITVVIIAQLGVTNLFLIFMGILFVVDSLLIVVVLTRFHRKRLIFE